MHKRGIIPAPEECDRAFEQRASNLADEGEAIARPFGLAPNWLRVKYSNQGLSFFEGGATWIGKHPFIQLRKPFEHAKRWFGYSADELLDHEAVHAMRSQYQEPRFEEILAYFTSPRSWRRRVGPLFRSTRIGYTLLVATLLPLFHPLLWAVPSAIVCWMGWKLSIDLQLFKRALQKTSPATLLCMRDCEIERFARGESLQLGKTPRERLLKALLQQNS